MKAKEFGQAIMKFFDNNKEIIMKSAMTVGLLALATKFNIPISVGRSGNIDHGFGNNAGIDIRMPVNCNTEERAILSFANTALTSDWSSSKIDAAKKIGKIALGSISDDTKQTAISCLEGISNTLDWDSSKQEVSKIIYEIVAKTQQIA